MNGIHIQTNVTVEWAELGGEFAERDSTDQSRFLLAFGEMVDPMQLPYITGDIRAAIGKDPARYSLAKHGLLMFAHHIFDTLDPR